MPPNLTIFMTANALTSFIFNLPKLAKLWRGLSKPKRREIAKRADEIKTSDDFLKVFREIETGQKELF